MTHNACNEIRRDANELLKLAASLREVGMATLACKLAAIGNRLKDQTIVISNAEMDRLTREAA
jgi:hypothetical protein